jgi:hypothetical protein
MYIPKSYDLTDKSNPKCDTCKGTGVIGTYFHAIDDNDLEPCVCVQENEFYEEHAPKGTDLL